MIRTASGQRHNSVIRLKTAGGIHMITDSYVNWYLIQEGQSLTIVDAGMPTSWQLLHDAVRMLGRTVRDLKALVLTHAHFDHVGFAERARRELGLPVLCHKDEVSLTPLRCGTSTNVVGSCTCFGLPACRSLRHSSGRACSM